MAVGDIVTDTRYNNLRNRIATIMGTGAGTDGYGQAVSSVTVADNDVVRAIHMNTLYNDMVAARIHQVGLSDPSVGTIAQISIGDVIANDTSTNPNGTLKGYADFESLMTSIEADKFLLAASQASTTTGATSTKSNWNGVITHIVRITWASENDRRYFFNAGGEIRTSATIAGYVEPKSGDWDSMFIGMGTVKMNYTETTSTGTGSDTSIGFYDLTTSYQTIFSKSGSGVYSANSYIVEARLGAGNSTTQVDIRISFRDDATGNVDENVDGLLTSILSIHRATGPYVSVLLPSAVTTTAL